MKLNKKLTNKNRLMKPFLTILILKFLFYSCKLSPIKKNSLLTQNKKGCYHFPLTPPTHNLEKKISFHLKNIYTFAL